MESQDLWKKIDVRASVLGNTVVSQKVYVLLYVVVLCFLKVFRTLNYACIRR